MGTPTFSVRFEAQDDFLVEYTDRLRHGVGWVPLPSDVAIGSRVRLRYHLPDGNLLHLVGVTQAAGPTDPDGGTVVRLAALTPAQREVLDRCVDSLVGAGLPAEPTGFDATAPGDNRTTSVLLVDDSVSIRIELGDALRAKGLKVRVAENGLIALSSALKRAPDVVLTDVEMPVMDGWTLLRSIRARPKLADLPVVFFTRLSDDLSRLRGYRLGVDDYLSKTMPAEEIAARLAGVLARKAQPANASGVLRGQLEHVRLGSLLAFFESERRVGVLWVQHGADRVGLYLGVGGLALVDDLGPYEHAHDRVFDLLGWSRGVFEFQPDVLPPPAATLQEQTPITYLLMEHARREDERRAAP